MDEFPFSQEEWSEVEDASRAIVDSLFAGDDILQASNFVLLQITLEQLKKKYGTHPVLLETEADFIDDVESQLHLYENAIRAAQENSLPTYSIRISVARILFEECNDPAKALHELLTCESEIDSSADNDDRAAWSELVAACRREAENGARESGDG
jgi:hypothetical protein